MIRIDVTGTPIPQGSMKSYGARGGRRAGALVADNPKLKVWRATVSLAARKALADLVRTDRVAFERGRAVVAGVLYRFALPQKYLDRRAGAPTASAPLHPPVKPDRDKLDRAIGDALTGAGCVWFDDAQGAIGASAKVYVPPGHPTGAVILLGDGDIETPPVLTAFVELLIEASNDLTAAIQEAGRQRAA